jgi:O-antigen ligase
MWGETWQMLKDRPILGAGLAGYQQVVEPYHDKEYIEIYLYPHNVILNFWSEVGILGLLAFLGIVIWFYNKGFKIRDNLSAMLMAGMLVILVHGLVDVPYFKNDLAILFWILVGGMAILNTAEIREIEENRV